MAPAVGRRRALGTTSSTASPLFTGLIWSGAFAAGFLGALTGLGGGVVIEPMLELLFGVVDLRYAIGASLISVIATSSGAAAAYVKEGYSNIRIGMFLEIATTVGALAGAFLALVVKPEIIAVIFGVVLLVSAYLSSRPCRQSIPPRTNPIRWRCGSSWTAIIPRPRACSPITSTGCPWGSF